MAYNLEPRTIKENLLGLIGKNPHAEPRPASTREECFLSDIAENGGGLPEVTAADNGDVLAVVNGAWAKSPAPSSLPPYTSADKGKVLTVGEGSESETVVVVPEQTGTVIDLTSVFGQLAHGIEIENPNMSFFTNAVAGDTIALNFGDGVPHDFTAVEYPGMGLLFASNVFKLITVAYFEGLGKVFATSAQDIGDDYTVSATASVPSVEPKWEGNNIMALPSQISTTFLVTVSTLIQTAIEAADYVPRIGSSATLAFQDEEEYYYVQDFIHRCVTRGFGYLQWSDFLANVCLIDPTIDDERIWFTIPNFVQGTYNFLVSVGLHLSLSDNKYYEVKIVIQQMMPGLVQ